MSNPWDPFPFPLEGDEDCRLTFEGIGRIITIWEHVEFTLARIYSIFVGRPDTDAVHEYGAPRIFRERIALLKSASCRWEIRHPSQRLEHFRDLMCADAELLAGRRNEIAHSVVFDVSQLPYFQDRLTRPGYRSTPNTLLSHHTSRQRRTKGKSRIGLMRRVSYRA
jgi:hypothetical protein